MKVSDLKKLNFGVLTLDSKIALKNNGRPLPHLNIVQEQKQYKNKAAFTRRFNKSVYKKTPWICGCEETNAFFCFVCLLFGGDDKWSKEGMNNLKQLVPQIKKHEGSKKHKHNFVSFQLLGKTIVSTCLNTVCGEAEEIRKHNEKVTKNRYLLGKIIDILRLCGKCNLSLRGHNEKEDSKNRGVFLEIAKYTRKFDLAFDSHMQEPHLFKGTPKTVQNELLQCMLDVCRQHITDEIRKSSFLSLMADDTTDVSSQAQTVLVFRYELNGKVHERFWGFAYQESQNAEGLSQCILQQLDSILEDCPDKLIAQTYDGGAVTRGYEGGVNVKIKEKYKNAHFMYCYAHQLNKLLEKAVSNIPSVRIFFANLNGIASFFSDSPDRRAALQQVCDGRVPRPSQTKWKFQSRVVQTVFNYKEEILQCLENIEMGIPKRYSTETVALSSGFANWFEDITFFFWLSFFSKIMPHVDVLFSQLQQIQADALNIQIAIDSFEKAITDIRDDLPSVSDDSQDPLKIEERPKKRRRLNTEDLNLSAKEVCDTIVFQVRDRFTCKEYFYGAKLFQQEYFKEYKRKLPFPLKDIEQFCKVFTMIDKNALITELHVFYSRPEVTEKSMSGCLKILNFLNSFGLDVTFPEITKVLKILVTIPITTPEAERCFPTLKNIKSYLKNTISEDRLTALAMISIEYSMIEAIPNFNEKVIEKFVADDPVRRQEFSFKQ
jgi:hypothetical protein